MKFDIQQLTNHSPIDLVLTAETINTRTGDKLVLFIPDDVSASLKNPVPFGCRGLDHLSLPKQPVIVLAEQSDNIDFAPYVGTDYRVTIGDVEQWVNDYVIYYRACVTSTDIDAFNQQAGKQPNNENDIYAGLNKPHVLVGSDLIAKPENGKRQSMNSQHVRTLILISVVAFWFLFGFLGFVWSDHPPLENIGYLLMGLVIWFAAVAAHWMKHNIRFVWFSSVVVLVTFWGIHA